MLLLLQRFGAGAGCGASPSGEPQAGREELSERAVK